MSDDVIPADSSPAISPENAGATAPESVPAPVSAAQGSERPVENLAAEFNRKFARLQTQYDTVMQYLASAQHSAPAAPGGEPTDDELWSLAQQGDRGAFDLYMRRVASQTGRSQVQQLERQRLIEQQLTVLATRYPVFNDASHPLTQQVYSTYQALLARGFSPGPSTLLEAMKTAIADRPDLVVEIHAKTSPAPLRRERAQAGTIGATVREEPVASSVAKPISKEEMDLARRMGVKDPAKAKERFTQRQEKGQSAFGAVASYVREE